MPDRSHWENLYSSKAVSEVSWFESEATASMRLIKAAGIARDSAIIDVGGGASPLAGDLLDAGYSDLTVLDISAAALEAARERLGERASRVRWLVADVTALDPSRRYQLWHDRAVLHFLTEAEDRAGYITTLRAALSRGGQAIIATFGPDGPERCSGLPVRRYSAEELAVELGADFELVDSELETHTTPSGASQQFQWSRLSFRPAG